ncbi:hypothetical protein CANINC_004887 [Pichia inconspicua]|uniref:B30.2/SPRY domain-containing protein n=1 Tax=Pichia inconspicua TaxID=52247 RepID=A0A4T0WV92_9ASCO|nr:hypothetical protein CANINC_004887 [[Candida] inconspicua]
MTYISSSEGKGVMAEESGPSAPYLPFLVMATSFLLMSILSFIIVILWRCCCSNLTDEYEENEVSLQYSEDMETENDAEALRTLSPNEQELYFQAKEYIKLNGFAKGQLSSWQQDMITEKGVHAWEFIPNMENQDYIQVHDKTELTFINKDTPFSIQSNLPIPFTKDTHYVEYKLFDIPEDSELKPLISLGLATYPYPSFVLPGRFLHSISYDSNGDRVYNYPFPSKNCVGYNSFPVLEKGDVVGVGIRKSTRSVFFTRNGRKVSETKIGGHCRLPRSLQIYPSLGTTNPCRIDVNFGQMGFVFIEANVKKWGLGPLTGSRLPPPLYTKFNHDVLLDASDTEDFELPEFEEVSNSGLNRPAEFTDDDRADDEYTLETITMPPNYENLIEDDILEAMNESIES